MFQKFFKLLLLIIFVANMCLPVQFALAYNIGINTSVGVHNATLFTSTPNYKPGEGKCELTWTSSGTPNVTNQEIYIDDGGTLISISVPFPGPGISNSGTPLEITGLIVGWPYTIRHVTEAGTLESSGVWTVCTPSAANPAPVLNAEPNLTEGTGNTLSWTNGGVPVGSGLTCVIDASIFNLNNASYILGPYVASSPPIPCDDPTQTYSYTFTGLTLNTTYFYHVRSHSAANGDSPYSNVEFSTQYQTIVPPPAGGGTTPPPAGGGTPLSFCGDGDITGTEACDDGNLINGDGCSSFCTIEHAAAPALTECGDGNPDAGEECDDGNVISGDGCSNICALEPLAACGNNILETPEECDDGNLTNGDGCSDICEEEIVEVTLHIKGAPEYRAIYNSTPNLSLNSGLGIFKPSISNLDILGIRTNDYGEASATVQMVVGTYDFALNGEAHLAKVIRGINIGPATTDITLDFTYANTIKLVAGDTRDDNYVNALDIATMLGSYKYNGTNLNDLNKDRDPAVNALDIAILIWNYKKEGEYL